MPCRVTRARIICEGAEQKINKQNGVGNYLRRKHRSKSVFDKPSDGEMSDVKGPCSDETRQTCEQKDGGRLTTTINIIIFLR